MTTVSPTTWYSFPAQDTHTTEVLKNNMSGEKLKKGKNGAQSKKKDRIELDHLHEHDISFWRWLSKSKLSMSEILPPLAILLSFSKIV